MTITLNIWLFAGITIYAMLCGAMLFEVFFKDDNFEEYVNWKLPFGVLIFGIFGGAIIIISATWQVLKWLVRKLRYYTEITTLFSYFVLGKYRGLTIEQLYVSASNLYARWNKDKPFHRYKRWVIQLILNANDYVFDREKSEYECKMWSRVESKKIPYRENKARMTAAIAEALANKQSGYGI